MTEWSVPTCLSLFSGIGALDLGLERAGWQLVGQVENDPFCRRVLARHWLEVPRWGNIRDVDPQQLPRADLVAFGFPCQDLSIAGRRGGLGAARSGLFWEAIRIVRSVRPALVLVENVPGLLSSGYGRDFGAVLDALADCGALDVAWRLCDSRHWRVPQRRRRVYLVGDFGAERAGAVLAERAGGGGRSMSGRGAGESIACALTASARGRGDGHENARDSTCIIGDGGVGEYDADDGQLALTRTLTGSQQHLDATAETYVVTNAQGEARSAREMALAFDAGHAPQAIAFHPTQDPIWSAAVTPALGHDPPGVAIAGPLGSVRRLTPLEAERLQALPDGWTCLCGVEPYSTAACRCSDGPRYRGIGNAVTVSVAEWLGRRLLCALRGEEQAT